MGCDTCVGHTEDGMAYDLLSESAVIPPEVQHQAGDKKFHSSARYNKRNIERMSNSSQTLLL